MHNFFRLYSRFQIEAETNINLRASVSRCRFIVGHGWFETNTFEIALRSYILS